MPKTNVKIIHKEKKQKKAGCDPNTTNSITTACEKDRQHSELPNKDAVQTSKDIKISSTMGNFENYEIIKENSDSNQEIVSLQEKIMDLINQCDELIRYHNIFTSFDTNDYSKNINLKSLESEIANLKVTVEVLKTGFNFVLEDHSVIKHLISDQLKDVNRLLEWNVFKGYPKNMHNCSEHLEKLVSPLFNKNSGYLNNVFGNSEKNDSMAKFRQLAELKIIIEILQKYSKIVTDEFKSVNSNMIVNYMKDASESTFNGPEDTKKRFIGIPELIKNSNVLHNTSPTQEPFDLQCKINDKTHQQNYSDRSALGIVLPLSENLYNTSRNINTIRSSFKPEVNQLKINFEMPQEGLIIPSNKCKERQTVVIEEQLQASSDVFKYNSREDMKHTLPKSVEYNTNKCKSLKGSPFLGQPNFKIENKWRMVEPLSTVFMDSFEEDPKNTNKKKVLFLSDGHGRYCSQILQDELGCGFSVISVVKPDAYFEEIIRDFYHLASSFSREDYVIICAGSNNLKYKDKTQSKIEFELVLPVLEHTNVIFTRIPLLFDFPSRNSQIRRVNSENSKRVLKLARKYSNILQMPKLTFFSRGCQNVSFNINKIGKKALCKLLAKTIINDSFSKRQRQLIDSKSNKSCKSSASISSGITSNKNKHKIGHPLKKSVQTQTIKEYLDYSLQVTGNKLLNGTPKWHSVLKANTTSKNINEKANFNTQSTMTESNSNTSRLVEDITSNHYIEDYGQRQGFFAGIFMKNSHANMTTIKELLGQGDIPKPKKNFIQENVKRLKELKLEKTNKLSSQRSKNLQPLTERRNAHTMVSSSRFSQRPSVSGRPSSQQSPSPPLRSRRPTKHVTLDTQLPIVEVDESPKGYRSQGCQTLNGRQLEHLYEEGVIRYPSVREMMSEGEGCTVREMALQTEAPLDVLHPPPPPYHTDPSPSDEGGLHWDEEKRVGDKDFVRMNATIPDPRRHKDNIKTLDPSSTDPTRAPPTYQRGVVPKYLREHKKEMERERVNKAKEEECPEGHIQLPDDIKQKHLTTLRQNYAELVSQLNQLPVSTDTLRTRTRKKQIETDLDRIEGAIALFSREKVFVKADS